MSGFGGLAGQQVKRTGDIGPVTFNFISVLAPGEAITGQSVTAAVYSGDDANPSGIISGAATHSDGVVSQELTGGVAGVIYQLVCQASTDLGNTYHIQSYLAVVPALV